MIHMPRRSVTRFFIPLIDVLLLLFCIFLLMPLVDEPGDAASVKNKTGEDPARLWAELQQLRQERAQWGQVQQLQAETERLGLELANLRQQKAKLLGQRLVVHVLDIDGQTGALSFQDGPRPLAIAQQHDALELIARHRRQAGGRELYYHFRRPPNSGFPTRELRAEYGHWFGQVANSLAKEKPGE